MLLQFHFRNTCSCNDDTSEISTKPDQIDNCDMEGVHNFCCIEELSKILQASDR